MNAVDDKVVEVKDRLRVINDMIEKNEESKRVLGIVKNMFKEQDNKLDNRFGNFENSFSELLIKNIQTRRIVGQAGHFANQVDFFTWIQDTIIELKSKTENNEKNLLECNFKINNVKENSENNKNEFDEYIQKLESEII